MVVCFMAAVMMMTVGCQKKDIAPIIPEGCLPGLFSVSETQQVYFSRGNLQYQASTNTWRFAEHQYDYVGTQTADGNGYYGGNVSGSDNRRTSLVGARAAIQPYPPRSIGTMAPSLTGVATLSATAEILPTDGALSPKPNGSTCLTNVPMPHPNLLSATLTVWAG